MDCTLQKLNIKIRRLSCSEQVNEFPNFHNYQATLWPSHFAGLSGHLAHLFKRTCWLFKWILLKKSNYQDEVHVGSEASALEIIFTSRKCTNEPVLGISHLQSRKSSNRKEITSFCREKSPSGKKCRCFLLCPKRKALRRVPLLVYTRCVQPAVESFGHLEKQNNRKADGQVCWVGLGEGEHLKAGGLRVQELSSQELEEQARGGTS